MPDVMPDPNNNQALGNLLGKVFENLNNSTNLLLTLVGTVAALIAAVFPDNPAASRLAFPISVALVILVLVILVLRLKRPDFFSRYHIPSHFAFAFLLVFVSVFSIATWQFIHTTGYWTRFNLSSCTNTPDEIQGLLVTNSDDIYISIELKNTDGVLCKSSDGGNTWQVISPKTSLFTAFVSDDSGAVFAASSGGEFYKLNESENSLTLLGKWEDSQQYQGRIQPIQLIFDHTDQQTVYLLDIGTSSIYESMDGGRNWQKILSDSEHPTLQISSLSLNNNVLYAGTVDGQICISSDKGKTWDIVNVGDVASQTITGVVIDTDDPTVWYVAAANGFFHIKYVPVSGKAINLKVTPLAADLVNVFGNILALDATNPHILYANLEGGRTYLVLTKTSESISINVGPESENYVAALVGIINHSPKLGNSLYVATGDSLFGWQPSVITSLRLFFNAR